MPHRRPAVKLTACAALAAAVVATAGCGASKPAYCSDASDLQSSVKALSLTDGGLSGVQSQLKAIQAQAKTTIASAKSDFPSQTSALGASITGLTTAVGALPPSASPKDVLALGPAAASLKSAVNGFTTATGSKC
jgi:hypothetical protein